MSKNSSKTLPKKKVKSFAELLARKDAQRRKALKKKRKELKIKT